MSARKEIRDLEDRLTELTMKENRNQVKNVLVGDVSIKTAAAPAQSFSPTVNADHAKTVILEELRAGNPINGTIKEISKDCDREGLAAFAIHQKGRRGFILLVDTRYRSDGSYPYFHARSDTKFFSDNWLKNDWFPNARPRSPDFAERIVKGTEVSSVLRSSWVLTKNGTVVIYLFDSNVFRLRQNKKKLQKYLIMEEESESSSASCDTSGSSGTH
eukprot:gb/GECG01010987.1/.p1 GENE.gb/GECG01010987.1/~~gb/GECG01010987.1/.p1  ORF type:complete len:216 (+),score=28.28 gb/GECG01010987.1/:1-648(+)